MENQRFWVDVNKKSGAGLLRRTLRAEQQESRPTASGLPDAGQVQHYFGFVGPLQPVFQDKQGQKELA
jgi:hypothetical protein